MNRSRIRFQGTALWNGIRPAALGLLLSLVVTAVLIALFSLFFVIIESITQSAIIPLALISAAFGCFVGAYSCGMILKSRGLLMGAIIGFIMFIIIIIVGLFCSDIIFGTQTGIKMVLLLIAGSAGGYFGGNRKVKRRK